MENNNNLIVAIVLSVLILVGFQFLYIKPQQEQYKQQVLTESQMAPVKATTTPDAPNNLRDRSDVIKDDKRIPIATRELQGSINLKGGRIDDLSLTNFRESVDPASPRIILLSPSGSAAPNNAFYTELSWLSDNTATAVPTSQTEWKADGKQLSPDHPLKLTWDNGQGLSFERTINVDDHFMFTINDKVQNKGNTAVKLYPFGLVARQGSPASSRSSSVLFEGPLGVLNGTLEEVKYKKLMDTGKQVINSDGGWLGLSDKYWLVAMAPEKGEKIAADFIYNQAGQKDPTQGWFQSDFRGSPQTLEAGSSLEHSTHLFAGAKRIELLDAYGDKYDIPHFDKAIDFGMFYFLTKPFLYLLAYLGQWLGSLGIGILVFTVILKLLTLPLSLKSYHSMARMKALQPEMKRIQERYADDKVRQSQEMMEFYKREKVNPMAGCLPQIIQIPIFFALYKVLYVGIELRQAPFYGWIKDMSVPDPTSWFNLFGLAPWDIPAQTAFNLGLFTVYFPPAIHIGIWPLLMGCSMLLQQRLSPQPPDKTQARMFMFMPIFFTYLLSSMPAGLVIYWTWSNLLSILQQWFIMRKDARKGIRG